MIFVLYESGNSHGCEKTFRFAESGMVGRKLDRKPTTDCI